jgi:hypothetical protein
MLVMFCRELKVPVASMQRLGWIGDMKACITEWVETRMRRWCTNHQSEVPSPGDMRQHVIGPPKVVL